MNCQSPKKDTKETKLETLLRLLFLPPLNLGLEYAKYTVAGPWHVPCLPESLGCVEAGWSWSQPTAAPQVSVFRLEQGQTRLFPHFVKIMGFFGLMQVLCGTWDPNLKGAWVTGMLLSGFALFYFLGIQYYPGICSQNCFPHHWCDLCFIQHVRLKFGGLAGEKLFWFQHYLVAPRTLGWSFPCFFLA